MFNLSLIFIVLLSLLHVPHTTDNHKAHISLCKAVSPVHSHNSPRVKYFDLCTVFIRLTTGTDPTYILIFTETPVLFPPNFCPYAFHGNMSGMSRPGCSFLQTCFLFAFICISCFKHTVYSVQCKLLLYICKRKHRRLHIPSTAQCKNYSVHKMRKLIARGKYIQVEHITALFLILLLLLCGDVHLNPGPILPGSRRHPDAQSLNVGSWNVRTLLPTKRAAGRPTALISKRVGQTRH